MFNPIKSVCVVSISKSNKLYCTTVSLNCNILEYILLIYTKYLGFTFSMNVQGDDDMLRQIRTLNIRANKLLRTFYHCSINVKPELFRSFCTTLQGRQSMGVGGVATPPEFWKGGLNPP